MKKNVLLSALCFLSLISCSKQEGLLETHQPGDLSIKKLAAVIPPNSTPEFRIQGFKEEDIIADSMQVGYIYKNSGNGNAYAGKSDSIVAVDLDPYRVSRAMLKYDFIKGNQYTITIPVAFKGYDESGWPKLDAKSYFPSIQVYTLKNFAGTTSIINSTHQERVVNDPTVKWEIYGPANQDAEQEKTLTLTFTPDECFKFIGFTFSSNVEKKTSVYVKRVSIKSVVNMQFNGEKDLCLGQSQVISYRTNSGYTINEPVNWYVKGDLEILGSSYGATVTVKSVGMNGGIVGYHPCSSDNKGIEYSIRTPDIDASISGPATVTNGSEYTFSLNDIDIQSYTWEVKPIQFSSIVSGKNSSSAVVQISGITNANYNGTLTVNCLVTDKCGNTKLLTKAVVMKGCKTCPIN